jgi:hypothetical protein
MIGRQLAEWQPVVCYLRLGRSMVLVVRSSHQSRQGLDHPTTDENRARQSSDE